jgi:hypothetical protein
MNLRQSNGSEILTTLHNSQDTSNYVVGIPLQEIPIEYSLSQTNDVHPLASSQEPIVTVITASQADSEPQESNT